MRLVVVYTYWRVHGAQEELEVRRTLDLHQRPELMHLQSRLLLGLVVELVGHVRVVVAQALTHRDVDLFTLTLVVSCVNLRGHQGQGQEGQGQE